MLHRKRAARGKSRTVRVLLEQIPYLEADDCLRPFIIKFGNNYRISLWFKKVELFFKHYYFEIKIIQTHPFQNKKIG